MISILCGKAHTSHAATVGLTGININNEFGGALSGDAVKYFSSCFQQLCQCAFSPGEGEKVADRPDEGVFAVSVVLKMLHSGACPGSTFVVVNSAICSNSPSPMSISQG